MYGYTSSIVDLNQSEKVWLCAVYGVQLLRIDVELNEPVYACGAMIYIIIQNMLDFTY